MRRVELAGPRWRGVDLDGGTLTVAQQRTVANHEVVSSAPKGRSQRQIVLAPVTVTELRQHRAVQLCDRLALGEKWADSGYVFVDEAGQPYHPDSFLTMYRRACARADVPSIQPHDVRHTMTTLAPQAGVHPKVVLEQLGHSATTVTMDIFSQVRKPCDASAGKIEALFESAD
jgi:integrase